MYTVLYIYILRYIIVLQLNYTVLLRTVSIATAVACCTVVWTLLLLLFFDQLKLHTHDEIRWLYTIQQ